MSTRWTDIQTRSFPDSNRWKTSVIISPKILLSNFYAKLFPSTVTELTFNQFSVMNILDNLGFSKKGSRNADPTSKSASTAPEGKYGRFTLTDTTPRSEGESRIYNLIILDESGSMSSIRNAALCGANETIQGIKAAQAESPQDNQMLSFVTFDSSSRRDDVRAIIRCSRIEEVGLLSSRDYNPCGCTPLYDAMGMSIECMKENVKEGDSVLVTVITDGYENSSRLFTASMIKEMVDGLRSQGWMFTYIGANQDSVEKAREVGIQAAMDFQPSQEGTEMMYRKMNSSNRAFYKKSRAYRHGMISREELMDEEDFFAEKSSAARTTPGSIDSLSPTEILVFPFTHDPFHAEGAAKAAYEKFGARKVQAEGPQGQCYAIPASPEGLYDRTSVFAFIGYADFHSELTFYVTSPCPDTNPHVDEINARMFADATALPNVFLPESFWRVLNYKYRR